MHNIGLKHLQVFDGEGTSSSEVYVEQGAFSGRRRRRSLPAAASQSSLHSSAKHEQVLTRRLLSLKEEDRSNDFLDSALEHKESLGSHWPQNVSVYTIVGVLVVSFVVLAVSVVVWARRRQKSGHPF